MATKVYFSTTLASVQRTAVLKAPAYLQIQLLLPLLSIIVKRQRIRTIVSEFNSDGQMCENVLCGNSLGVFHGLTQLVGHERRRRQCRHVHLKDTANN